MMRARLLIYDGTEEWIAEMRANEFIKPDKLMSFPNGTIRSAELIDAEITLVECKLEGDA